jgi:tetratricopeptide (TPR) repeat protein
LQPIFPYFLRNRLYEPEQAEVKSAIETAFREHYDQLGDMLYDLLKSKDPQERQAGQLLTSLEYENLVTALNLALAGQVSFYAPYLALSQYLDLIQDQRRGLELGQTIRDRLDAYPPEKLTGPLGIEVAGVIDNIATRQLHLKQYEAAKALFQEALTILLENKQYDVNDINIKKNSAAIYHRLGKVAQEQRQWQQAEQYYQQALQIYIEYNDRYAQASTYGELGLLSQEQQQWSQARDYFLQALEIFIAYSDDHYIGGTVYNLARLWRATNDASLPAAVANVLSASVEETEKLLRKMLGDEPGEAGQ